MLGSMGPSDTEPSDERPDTDRPDTDRPDTDRPDERMLIVRHERLDGASPRHERFWLGDIDADIVDVVASIDVWVDHDAARLGAPLVTDPAEAGSAGKEPADGDTDRLGRRLVAAVLRELVGRGVTRIGIAEGVTGCLSDELRGLGFAPVLGSTTWEAVGAG